MPPRSLPLFGALIATLGTAPALAQDDDEKQVCKEAYEAAQERRLEKRLIEAREQLHACVQDACPAFVRKDCATWLDEVERAIPTVVLRFVDETGAERNDVTVTVDGKVLVDTLDGGAVAVDPGPHAFVFEPAGGEAVTREITVVEGDRLREVAVDRSPPPLPVPPPAPPPVVEAPSVHPAAWILYGTSAAALGAFIGLGVHSLSLEDCKPNCTDDQVDDVVLFRALADVSLGVSALSLGGAIWITVASLASDDEQTALQVQVSPTGAGATVRF